MSCLLFIEGCDYQGTNVAEGASITYNDGCTVCTCQSGHLSCDSTPCK